MLAIYDYFAGAVTAPFRAMSEGFIGVPAMLNAPID